MSRLGWGHRSKQEPEVVAGYGGVVFTPLPRSIEENEPDPIVRLRAVSQALGTLVTRAASDGSTESFSRFVNALKGSMPFTIGMGDHASGSYVKLEITVYNGEEGVRQALSREDGSLNPYRSDMPSYSGPTQSAVERGMWAAINGAIGLDSL